jgi:hypothetical protein
MPAETDRATSGRSFSVLIVEDEVLIAMDLKDMLERNGHQRDRAGGVGGCGPAAAGRPSGPMSPCWT